MYFILDYDIGRNVVEVIVELKYKITGMGWVPEALEILLLLLELQDLMTGFFDPDSIQCPSNLSHPVAQIYSA